MSFLHPLVIAFKTGDEVPIRVFGGAILNWLYVKLLALALFAFEEVADSCELALLFIILVCPSALHCQSCNALTFFHEGSTRQNSRIRGCHLYWSELTGEEARTEIRIFRVTQVWEQRSCFVCVIFWSLVMMLIYLIFNFKSYFGSLLFLLLGGFSIYHQINKLLSNAISQCVPSYYAETFFLWCILSLLLLLLFFINRWALNFLFVNTCHISYFLTWDLFHIKHDLKDDFHDLQMLCLLFIREFLWIHLLYHQQSMFDIDLIEYFLRDGSSAKIFEDFMDLLEVFLFDFLHQVSLNLD